MKINRNDRPPHKPTITPKHEGAKESRIDKSAALSFPQINTQSSKRFTAKRLRKEGNPKVTSVVKKALNNALLTRLKHNKPNSN